jgi:hypothetical protein
MRADFSVQVQVACDDLYCDPFDEAARARVRKLLAASPGASTLMSPRTYCRRVRIACDELHDYPTDIDAQHALLLLTTKPDLAAAGA